MGRRGTRPKPLAEHELNGTLRNDRHGESMKTPAGVPDAPDYLKGEALKEWRRVIDELGPTKVLSPTDQGMLAAYCDALATYRTLLARIEKDKWVSIGSTGRETSHCLIPAMHTARADMLKYAREFGLTPSARTSIKFAPAKEPTELEKTMLGIVG